MITIGTLTFQIAFVGNAEVKSVWIGNAKIYESNDDKGNK